MGLKLLELAEEKGEEKGLQRGIAQGIEQGIEQGVEKVATNMLTKGMTIKSIAEVTGLSLYRIRAIKKRLAAEG